MNVLFIYLCIFLFLFTCKKNEEFNEESNNDKVVYKNNLNIKNVYYDNGNIKFKQKYNNLGELDGEWIHYRENGSIIQKGNYKNNVPNGQWTTYDKKGAIKAEEFIKINSDCVDMVALWSAEDVSKKIGRDKKWVFLNYTFPLWDKPSIENANKIGELRVMSYSEILDRSDDFYYVLSTNKKQKGWIKKN